MMLLVITVEINFIFRQDYLLLDINKVLKVLPFSYKRMCKMYYHVSA